MFNKNKEEEGVPELNNFYLSIGQGSTDEIIPAKLSYDNIYQFLICAYSYAFLRSKLDKGKKFGKKEEKHIVEELIKLTKPIFEGKKYFELKDRNDYINFEKDIYSLSYFEPGSLSLVGESIQIDSLDEKDPRREKLQKLFVDSNIKFLGKESDGSFTVSAERSATDELNLISKLAKKLKNGETLLKLFDNIKATDIGSPSDTAAIINSIGKIQEKIFSGTDGKILSIKSKEDISYGKSGYNFTFYENDIYTDLAHLDNAESTGLMVKFPDGIYTADNINKSEVETKSLFKMKDNNKKITKYYIPGLDYAYEHNEKTNEYRILDTSKNNRKNNDDKFHHFSEPKAPISGDFVEVNGCYYGIGNAVGIKATPIDDDGSFLKEKDPLYKVYNFETNNEKGEKVIITIPASFSKKAKSLFPQTCSFNYEVHINGKKADDPAREILTTFINNLKGKIIDRSKILEFNKDENLSKDDLLKLQLHSFENNGKHIGRENNIIQNEVDKWYKKINRKKENNEAIQRPKRIEITDKELRWFLKSEIRDEDKYVKENSKELQVEELTTFEKFIDFFIDLFGLGETYADEKQIEFENKLVKIRSECKDLNEEIIGKQKIFVQKIIENFNNGYILDDETYKQVIDKLQKENLRTAIGLLGEAKDLCRIAPKSKNNEDATYSISDTNKKKGTSK